MIRLLVADDETLVREALAVLLGLEPDITVIAQADNGSDAVALAESRLPDIAVLDLEMPPQDGLWAAELIRERSPGVKVMLVTRHARPGVLRRALAAGVSGFVPKTTPAERLAQIIRDIGQGKRYVDPEIAASALTEDRSPLTERELDLLRAARAAARSRRSRPRCTSPRAPCATTCPRRCASWTRRPVTRRPSTRGSRAGSRTPDARAPLAACRCVRSGTRRSS